MARILAACEEADVSLPLLTVSRLTASRIFAVKSKVYVVGELKNSNVPLERWLWVCQPVEGLSENKQ